MIRLEYFTREDFAQLINWIDSEDLLTNWAGSLFHFPLAEKSMEWYITETNDVETSSAFVYKVVDVNSGDTVGHISLGNISKKNRSARISRVLIGSGHHRGKGYCKDMVSAILKFGFAELKLHRISLGVYDFNKPAIRCYQASGFTIEGVSRDILRHNDSWWSLVEMSILETEWKDREL